MAKSRFVKLGEKASSFSDATSGLKLAPGQVVELSRKHKNSRRVINAIKAGHLDYADLEDYDEAQKLPGAIKTSDDPIDDSGDDSGDGNPKEPHTEKSLKKLKHPELVELAKEMGTEEDLMDLEDYTKAELAEEILELQANEED